MAVAINADGANIPAVNFVDQGSDPANPGSGHVLLYTKGGVPYVRGSSGAAVPVGAVPTLAEGQIAIGDASDELSALALGTEGDVLTADAAGMATWAAPAAGGGYTEGARVRRTTDQTITTATSTAVVFDTQDYDTDTIWEGVTNPSRLTATTAGKYLVTGCVYWAGAVTGQRHAYIYKNGSAQVGATVVPANTLGQGVTLSALVSLAQGDYLQLLVYHDRGSNLAIIYYAEWSPLFAMQRVG